MFRLTPYGRVVKNDKNRTRQRRTIVAARGESTAHVETCKSVVGTPTITSRMQVCGGEGGERRVGERGRGKE